MSFPVTASRLGCLVAILLLIFGTGVARAETRFVTLGHLRALAPNHVDILDALAEAIAAEKPDYIFMLGDLTFDGDERHWAVMDVFLKRLRAIAPVLSVPGNHEMLQVPLDPAVSPSRPKESYLDARTIIDPRGSSGSSSSDKLLFLLPAAVSAVSASCGTVPVLS